MLRLGACLGVDVHIVGPTGFRLDDRALKRAGLDYLDRATMVHHGDWAAFETWRNGAGRRLVLATTRATTPHVDFSFLAKDIILLGRESAGVPGPIHDAADASVAIPMQADLRSLNIAVAGAMILGEALRQTGGFE